MTNDELFEITRGMLWNVTNEFTLKQDIISWAENTYTNFLNFDRHEIVPVVAALVLVINHRCWYWEKESNEELMKIYTDLYYKYNYLAWDWLEANGTDEEKQWFFETLD